MELNNNILKTFLKPAGDDILPTPELRRHANLYKYLLNDAHSICTYDNKVQIITDGNEKFKSLLHDIENAKDSINLLYFIIHNDDIGKRVLDALTRKANEGVEVRLLYDGFGSILTPRRSFRKLGKCPDGHVAEFFPVRLFSFSKLNHRNHRKIAVIDGKIAYLGGMNIGDEYLSRKKLVWRDTHMRITGSAVNEIQNTLRSTGNFPPTKDSPTVFRNSSRCRLPQAVRTYRFRLPRAVPTPLPRRSSAA